MEEIKQPTINIGLLGHVANGKSSLVRCITGEKTARNDSRCMQKGESREMTIQIGYSNAKIYECTKCPKPLCYASIEGSKKQIPPCTNCGEQDSMKLITYVSFVDSPGHRKLMRNMISGSAVMDGVILVTDSNVSTPQIQTVEHLTAAEIMGINHYIAIAQNKIDLMINEKDCKKRLQEHYKHIDDLVLGTAADLRRTPVIPTCFSPARQINLQLLLQYIVERARPTPNPAYQKYPMFIHCVRSFDINKPGLAKKLKGGVIGGTIMNGTLKIGDTLEIRPGYRTETGEFRPLLTTVTSLYTGCIPLTEARPGGLIGIGTTLDPALTRSDNMVGMCAGYPGQLPESKTTLHLRAKLLDYAIGHDQEIRAKVGKLHKGDLIQLSIGSAAVNAKLVRRVEKGVYEFQTSFPVCPVPGQNIPMSKVIESAWTIIGKAELADCANCERPPQPIIPFEDYQSILDRTLKLRDLVPEMSGIIRIPPPVLGKEGGSKLIWTNFGETCKAINREPAHVNSFFAEELATKTSIGSSDELIIHGRNRYREEHISNLLIKYMNNFVKCPACESVYTKLTKRQGSKFTQLLCQKCGAEYLR